MACNVLKSISMGRQEFRICADAVGNLHLEIASPGKACTASLAEARLDPDTGKYMLIEYDVYVPAADALLDSIVRGECEDRKSAIQMLVGILP